jgi:chromatin remodeling complex protein RSC6
MAKASKKAAVKSSAKKGAAKNGGAAKKASSKGASKKAAAGKIAGASKKSSAKKGAAKKSTRKPNAAFMAPLQPNDTLGAVVGNKPLPRTEIVKKVWDYIKKAGLQDKNNKRMINADEKTKALFGKNQISMFDLAKIVNNNIKK